jgi:uncharacterized membrane protein (UPF0127 family)
VRRFLVILSLLLVGCSQVIASPMEKIEISVGSHHLTVELAADEISRARGLMFRKSLSENEGMLFDFKEPGIYSFWMKNTLIPLSIAFLNARGEITKIDMMTPEDTTHFHRSPMGTRYGLEVKEGWFKRHDVYVGDKVLLPT